MRRRRCGFSLAEITMMMLIFGIFSLGLVASLTLSMQYWKRTSPEITAEQNARVALQTMAGELRQASHPSTWSSAFLTPSVNASAPGATGGSSEAINEFSFTESSPTNAAGATFDPLFVVSPDTPDDPQYYQTVVYWIGTPGVTTPSSSIVPTAFSPFTSTPNPLPTPLQPGGNPNINSLPNWGNTLYRTVLHYGSSGNQISSTTAAVVQCADQTLTGQIHLVVIRDFNNAASLEVQTSEQGIQSTSQDSSGTVLATYDLQCDEVCALYH